MIPFGSAASTQIRFLFQSLNGSNSDTVIHELRQYLSYGVEGSILLLRTCIDHLNVYGKDSKNTQLDPVFASIFRCILDKPNFSTVLSESLKDTAISEEFLVNLSNAFHLAISEKIGVGLALSDSENVDVKKCGTNYCMGQIAELRSTNSSLDDAKQIQNVLLFLNQSEGLSKHVDLFMHLLSLVPSKEAQFILTPLLSDEFHEANFLRNLDFLNDDGEDDFDVLLADMEKEMSIADIMKELGYGCTASILQCKEMLSLFLPLTEVTVARILGMVVRTCSGIEDNLNMFSTFRTALGSISATDPSPLNSWNADILIDAIKQFAPELNWVTVLDNLDHEGFYIPDEAAFSFLMSIYKHACQDPFPLETICGSIWKNAEGQLSLLKYAVSVPPEVFTFAHSRRQLDCADAVNDHKIQNGHANHAWLCLDLLEVLCQLAEIGYASSVRSILEHPLKHCPEVLLHGMAHINTAYNLLQHEVAAAAFPVMLKNAAARGMMILHLWHVNTSILCWGVVEALDVDLDNMHTVLDACQELKILSSVLDRIPFAFGIRLAALASRKELLDLEKWLSNNLNTYKDTFYEACLKFLREIHLAALDDASNHFDPPSALLTIYSVLKSHSSLVSSCHLSEELDKLHIRYMDAKLRLKSVGGADTSISDGGGSDAIEAEANVYFHQMFSGQLSNDATVQMLARFKESTEKREQAIFECMIANLFEEYKFLSKYPERQLRIAAVLFGSLIKNQLVTHLALGIALRAVLDALRKPADSKMFVFGILALEQFVDRLIEWPQYCNHILQISHLRVANPELVVFIERALARISLAHSESEVGHSPAVDQFHGPIPSSPMNSEGQTFQVVGQSGLQQSTQGPSSSQLPLRQQSPIEERKPSAALSGYLKPALSPAVQPATVPSSDNAGIQKPQGPSSTSAVLTSSPGFLRPSRAITSGRFGSALNIETLVAAAERRETPIEAPASEIQDKISFIINNLSATNFEAKAKEFTEILKEQYYPWFAQYMVMKRASIEPNFHDLYLKFLDKANSKSLFKEIVQAT